MSLWTQMQEENTQPSDHFMWSLYELLKKNNLDVPFTVQKPKENTSSSPSDAKNNLINQLIMCVKNKNISKALVLRKVIQSKGSTNITPSIDSQIIELLICEKRLNEAFEITKDMLENDRPIMKSVLNFLVKNLSEAGNVASLEYLNRKVSKVGYVTFTQY